MRMKLFAIIASLVIFLLFTGPVSAELEVIGTGTILGGDGTEYNLIYDRTQDITWLDFTPDPAHWSTQSAWVQNLAVNFGDSTLDEWRLPQTDHTVINDDSLYGEYDWTGPDENGIYDHALGWNMTNSELGQLFHVTLGNFSRLDTDGNIRSTYGLVDDGPFTALYAGSYWSNNYPFRGASAWYFGFAEGTLGYGFQEFNDLHVLAVMKGNPASVPVPAAVWLLGSGLIGLAGLRRKMRR